MFEAGTDNTASGVLWFLVASMHNPGVVKQAQKEIDQVLGAGGETIPTYEHMAQLPYCLALIKEVLRYDGTFVWFSCRLMDLQLGSDSTALCPSLQHGR